MIVSHVSKEPGMQKILKELHMDAPLHADMCLGGGTGAVAYLPVLLVVSVFTGALTGFVAAVLFSAMEKAKIAPGS